MATPATLAGVTELSDWIGEPLVADSPEGKRAVLCLRVASALVRKESGQTWLETNGDLVTPVPEDAVMVTLYCASRVFDNRNAQTRGGLDDYSESWKVDESGAYITASEKRMLAQFRTSGFRGLGSVSTTRVESAVPSAGWVPTGTPDVLFPWY
jgi:hypothetical protein